MIKRLTVRAFKSLRSFDIYPQKINLLIGANGTGKTNFADLISFLAGVCRRGLSETIADLGGLPQIRTRSIRGAPYKLLIKIQIGEDRPRNIKEILYSFELAQSNDIKVQKESLDAVVYDRPVVRDERGRTELGNPQALEIHYKREGTSLKEWSDNLGPPVIDFVSENELLLTSPYTRGLRQINNYMASWRAYNIDPTIAKTSLITDDQDLRRDGSNIVPYVARILQNAGNRQSILRDLQDIVPYIEEIRPDRLLTLRTLRFTEKDTKTEFQLPEMSDGAIRLLGLLAVVNQRLPPAVMVIEEPENALHAYAIHRLLSRARQLSMRKDYASQIFFTSHSPIVVDELLNLDAMRETEGKTACFVTQRRLDAPSIALAPREVMQAIAQNLGRPSDFQREGSFGDEPTQVQLPLEVQEP
jgi:predicted ATPase